jgi:two-component system, NarL family, sensor kinase
MMGADANSLLQRNRELFILNHIAETLNRTTDINAALRDTLASVVELMGLQTGWIFLLDDAHKLRLAAHHELPPALGLQTDVWIGGCNCNTLFKNGELRTAVNIVECSRLAEAKGDRHGLVVHASAPLRSEERMLGILNVASPGWERFTPDTLLLLSAVGAQLGTAIERARLSQQAVELATLEERNRLARDIHDTLAQGLTAITLQLEAAEALATTKPDVAQRKVAQALDLARQNLEEARRSVLNLRAAPLQGQTLPQALERLARQWSDETGIAVMTKFDPAIERLPAAMENGLFRIAGEALTNVRNHAGATQVTLSLEQHDAELRLRIADNGAGFDPQRVAPTATSGYGITGMSERAHLLGGRFELHSAPGAGTRVDVIVNSQ